MDTVERVGAAYDIQRAALVTYQLQGLPHLRGQVPFLGMSDAEILDALAHARDRLQAATVLGLVSAIEAMFRVDLAERARNGKKARNEPFRALAKREKVRFDEILETWKGQLGSGTGALRELKQLFKHRHWLAHGGYWTDRSGIRPDPDDVLDVHRRVVALLIPVAPGFPLSRGP